LWYEGLGMKHVNIGIGFEVVPASIAVGVAWAILALLGVLGDGELNVAMRRLILAISILLSVSLVGALLRIKLVARRRVRNMRLSNRKLRHLERRLLEERGEFLDQLEQFDEAFEQTLQASDGDLSAYSHHMADQGTDAMEREQAFMLASDDGRELYEVDEALRKLYRTPERYGLCEQCGAGISFERLDVLPHARLCIRCKELEEKGTAGPAPRSRRDLHDGSEGVVARVA
jgi:RNA polymerase-binding transcription factor DksA